MNSMNGPELAAWVLAVIAHGHPAPTALHSTGAYWRWGLRAVSKDIWWKCGVGILGEIEVGEARFWGVGGEMGRVERR